MEREEIVYQNKDIISKVLAENFKGKSFQVYGLDLPEIRWVLPTYIPAVKANELRLDNLFELADGTVALVDYESAYRKTNKVKYLNYLTGIANRYLRKGKDCPKCRMIVIYTGDISRNETSDKYDIGALQMCIESAFLSDLDGDEIYSRLKEKVEAGGMLTDEELMEFIILPLSYPEKGKKEEKIRDTVTLAVQIHDRGQQVFALAGILAFTDKIIDRETANKIRRVIEMTQVAQIFEEEKQQAILQVTQKYEEEKQQAMQKYEEEKQQAMQKYEEEKQQALKQTTQKYEEEKQQALKDASRQLVINMIKKDYSSKEIASLVLDYSQDDVEKLREQIG